MNHSKHGAVVLLVGALAGSATCAEQASLDRQPLASWTDGPAKRAIVTFVERVTNESSPEFVPPAERVAVFDNDGTLWSEQPMYFQGFFVLDRIRALAPLHPEWKHREPFVSALNGHLAGTVAHDERALVELVMAAHAGMTTEEFDGIVRDWIARAKHPDTGRPYTQMVYQPMLEVLEYLRACGFKTYIVSGGGMEFMRAWAERVYGIPPEQVIGSSGKARYEGRDGKAVIIKMPEVDFIDDREGKPLAIQRHIGRRPIIAFGNSDGDFEMLVWTTGGLGPRLGVIVHHDDADREWAYDRDSRVGRLARGLDEGPRRGWIIVSLERDWKTIFPVE
jgi:phosphoglycolate phosphatase-like HAD superfamily hydrolase